MVLDANELSGHGGPILRPYLDRVAPTDSALELLESGYGGGRMVGRSCVFAPPRRPREEATEPADKGRADDQVPLEACAIALTLDDPVDHTYCRRADKEVEEYRVRPVGSLVARRNRWRCHCIGGGWV